MMKKTVSSILLAGALLLGTVAPVIASADTNGKTEDSITFNKPTGTTDPVDPTDPGTTDPDGPHGGTDPSTNPGDLSFLYISPKMQFGDVTNGNAVETTANAKTYGATVTTDDLVTAKNNKNLVTEVQDVRGTNAGWSVSISADPMVSGSDTLTGATLNFDGSKVAVTNSADAASGITGNTITDMPTDKTSKTLYNAKAGSGMLNTAFQLDPSNISLGTVPANVKAGTYSGDLNWTLSATPES